MRGDITTGVTADGHPWIGAENPQLTILEFSDYSCFQCRKMHFALRRIVSLYPKVFRLVHYHFPLDHMYNPVLAGKPMHIGAGKMALIAIGATLDGHFWQVNDELFVHDTSKPVLNLKELGKRAGIDPGILAMALRDPAILQKLRSDIALGIQYGVTSTPTFRVNDKIYVGNLPTGIIEKAVKESGQPPSSPNR